MHVYVLSNQNQTFGQSLAMVDNLPAGRGVVAIGINNNRFHFSPAEVALQARGLPLLLASPTLDRFLARNPASGLAMARLPGILPGVMDFLVGAGGARFTELGHRPGARPDVPAPLGHVEEGVVGGPQTGRRAAVGRSRTRRPSCATTPTTPACSTCS